MPTGQERGRQESQEDRLGNPSPHATRHKIRFGCREETADSGVNQAPRREDGSGSITAEIRSPQHVLGKCDDRPIKHELGRASDSNAGAAIVGVECQMSDRNLREQEKERQARDDDRARRDPKCGLIDRQRCHQHLRDRTEDH